MIKKYLINFSWSLGIIIIGTIFLALFNYFNILNGILLEIIEIVLPLVAIFIGGYKIGKVSNKNGYLEGLKYSAIWIIIFVISSLLLKSFHLSSIIYFLSIILISSLSAMLGINRKSQS